MTAKEVLQAIIDNDGSCNFATRNICTICPLNRYKQRADGTFYSCFDAIVPEHTAWWRDKWRQRYINVATSLLLDIIIKELLSCDK